MAARAACELAPELAGVLAYGSSGWFEPSMCQPAAPVPVLLMHGSLDTAVDYDGGLGARGAPYPSQAALLEQWRWHSECYGQPETASFLLDDGSSADASDALGAIWPRSAALD